MYQWIDVITRDGHEGQVQVDMERPLASQLGDHVTVVYPKEPRITGSDYQPRRQAPPAWIAVGWLVLVVLMIVCVMLIGLWMTVD